MQCEIVENIGIVELEELENKHNTFIQVTKTQTPEQWNDFNDTRYEFSL